MQARCRATPSYAETEDTGRKQRKRCLYLNWRKQIQLDYINLPSVWNAKKKGKIRIGSSFRKRHYSFPLLLKFHLLWGLNIINVSLLMRVLELQRMPPTILLKLLIIWDTRCSTSPSNAHGIPFVSFTHSPSHQNCTTLCFNSFPQFLPQVEEYFYAKIQIQQNINFNVKCFASSIELLLLHGVNFLKAGVTTLHY